MQYRFSLEAWTEDAHGLSLKIVFSICHIALYVYIFVSPTIYIYIYMLFNYHGKFPSSVWKYHHQHVILTLKALIIEIAKASLIGPQGHRTKRKARKMQTYRRRTTFSFFFLWKRSFIFLTPWAYACITHDSLYVYVQNSRSDKFPNCAFTLSSETNPSRSDFCTYITPFFFLSIWHAQPMKGFFLGERNCDHLHEEMCVSEPFFLDSHVKILMACTL